MSRYERKNMRRFYANRRRFIQLASDIDKAGRRGTIEPDKLIRLGERARRLVIEFGGTCTYMDDHGKLHAIWPSRPDSPMPKTSKPKGADNVDQD